MVQNNKFSTVFVGQPLIILQSVDSTNTYLKQSLSNSEPYPHGTVIMAVHQFAGRGQQNNVWHAKEGENLTFSLLLQPDYLSLKRQFEINKLVSIALIEVFQKHLPNEKVQIKWPNDILVNEKKIAGILIENTLQHSNLKNCIVGIGINVNQSQFAPEISAKTCSFNSILKSEMSLLPLLEEICLAIEKQYHYFLAGHLSEIHKSYLKQLFQFEMDAGFIKNGKFFAGVIKNVSEEGAILIQTKEGLECFQFKEIEFIL